MFDDLDDILKLGAFGALALIGFAGFKSFSNNIKENRLHNAYDDASIGGSTAEMAKNIIDAFEACGYTGCYGTEEEAVIRLIKQIPNKRFLENMKKDYKRLSQGGSFDIDFHDEFVSWGNTENDKRIYDELMTYIHQLPN